MRKLIQRYFKFDELQTNFQTECIAAITCFLTMAYVVIVNPAILAQAGVNTEAAFVATCLAAAFGSIAMGLLANYPIGLAPSMALNAYFTYVVVQNLGYSWPVALGAVFCAGVALLILTLLGIRQWIIYLLPSALKIGIATGIGLFLGVIGLKNMDLITIQPKWMIHFGAFTQLSVWLALFGLLCIFLLARYRIYGAILIGIMVVTVTGIVCHLTPFQGIFALPPSMKPTLFALQFPAFNDPKLLMVMLTFFLVAFFDSTGTLIAILQQAHLLKSEEKIPRITQALLADSAATIVGSLLGTSTTGSYIESTAGVKAGGRSGLMAIIIGLLFLLALFFAPLAKTIPAYATAPALLYVAVLMLQSLRIINWRNIVDISTALITALAIPLTFSIAEGICWGIITYVLSNLLTGKIRQLHPALLMLTGILTLFLAWQHYQ